MRKSAPPNTGRNTRGPGALPHLDFWRRSDQWRQIMRQAGLRATARWNAMPRCGAKKRSDGEPCGNAGLEPSGRCRFHGGKTPRGKDWHRIQPRAGKSDADGDRDRFKLKQKDRAVRARAKRLTAMTEAERAAHKQWQATHKPGAPGPRATERERRRQAREAGAMIARPTKTIVNPEVEAIDRKIAALQLLMREHELASAIQNREGVFA